MNLQEIIQLLKEADNEGYTEVAVLDYDGEMSPVVSVDWDSVNKVVISI